MKLRHFNGLSFGLITIMTLVAAGCGQDGSSQGEADGEAVRVSDASHSGHDHDHSGWWCAEHGLPEEDCAMCDAKLAAEYRERGDWCDEHQRPDSLCFHCHPENAEKYTALHVAKYGENPPQPTE